MLQDLKILVKASDLRIGNIHKAEGLSIPRLGINSIQVGGNPFYKITGQGISCVELGSLEFIPISLSKEWMIRFGYERANSIDEIYQKQGSPTVICIDGDYYIRGVYKPFNYVHEFQNIYYFITGVEL